MFRPIVGQRVKLQNLWDYNSLGVTPNWQWLAVGMVGDNSVFVVVLNGDKPTSDCGVIPLSSLQAPLGWREVQPGEYISFIPSAKVNEVREWFTSRGGVVRWVNKEIGASRGDILTPATLADGTPARAPHWAYVGESFPVQPSDIGVRDESGVALPPEWFPVCDRCDGTGRVSVKSLAKIRKETQKATLLALRADSRARLLDNRNIACWCCDGTGHKERHIRVAMRRRYWGREISDSGKAKAARIARKLGQGVKWDYQEIGYGLAELVFYRETIKPFTLSE